MRNIKEIKMEENNNTERKWINLPPAKIHNQNFIIMLTVDRYKIIRFPYIEDCIILRGREIDEMERFPCNDTQSNKYE